ncbi:uncharacterized protein LOC121386782 [Gigantopelta aegis]|uniref:uncharacterized protein LOC121386782 n=1 Tax=Gigantopelta aegis TaxID=1735272 RepID=UPI001B888120|nr:uncharacterized protein LOC121386782 [Gigantopelta aegis]
MYWISVILFLFCSKHVQGRPSLNISSSGTFTALNNSFAITCIVTQAAGLDDWVRFFKNGPAPVSSFTSLYQIGASCSIFNDPPVGTSVSCGSGTSSSSSTIKKYTLTFNSVDEHDAGEWWCGLRLAETTSPTVRLVISSAAITTIDCINSGNPGQSTNLTCNMIGNIRNGIQWYRPNGGTPQLVVECNIHNIQCDTVKRVTGYTGAIDSPSVNTLVIESFVTSVDAGEWICQDGFSGVGKSTCNKTLISPIINISIEIPGSMSDSVIITEGNSTVFTCVIRGAESAPSVSLVTWYKEVSPGENESLPGIPGSPTTIDRTTSVNLTYTARRQDQGQKVFCAATNSLMVNRSAPAVISTNKIQLIIQSGAVLGIKSCISNWFDGMPLNLTCVVNNGIVNSYIAIKKENRLVAVCNSTFGDCISFDAHYGVIGIPSESMTLLIFHFEKERDDTTWKCTDVGLSLLTPTCSIASSAPYGVKYEDLTKLTTVTLPFSVSVTGKCTYSLPNCTWTYQIQSESLERVPDGLTAITNSSESCNSGDQQATCTLKFDYESVPAGFAGENVTLRVSITHASLITNFTPIEIVNSGVIFPVSGTEEHKAALSGGVIPGIVLAISLAIAIPMAWVFYKGKIQKKESEERQNDSTTNDSENQADNLGFIVTSDSVYSSFDSIY